MTNRPGVYGFVDADGTSTWGPHLRRAVFGFVCLGLWVAVFTATGDLSDGWGAFFPDTKSVMVFLAVALAVGIPTWISWSAHRRFGSSRLIPDRTPRPGETLGAVLETGERLAHARDVRFDLVEMHRSGADVFPDDWQFSKHVRATTTVSMGAFQVAQGSTRIRLSLPVPADGWASFQRSRWGFSILEAPLFLGSRVTEHAWEVRASAEVEGARYRARFRVNVAPIASVPFR